MKTTKLDSDSYHTGILVRRSTSHTSVPHHSLEMSTKYVEFQCLICWWEAQVNWLRREFRAISFPFPKCEPELE